MLFNTGQAVTKKVQLANTADAAAYSVAVQQARAFNMIAYLNRAEVANEIAVAQMVSLQSWMTHLQSGIDHFKDALNLIGYVLDIMVVTAEVGVMLNEVAAALGEAEQVVKQVRKGTQKAFSLAITGISGLNQVYATSQQLVVASTLVDVPKVAGSIVSANAADSLGGVGLGNEGMRISHVGLAALEAQVVRASQFVKRYTVQKSAGGGTWTRAGADRYVNVVMEARDSFSRGRTKSYIFGWITERNGTDMVDYNRWVGVDTLNFHMKIPFPLCWKHCTKDAPLAWAATAAVSSNTRANAGIYRPGINGGSGWTSPYDLDSRKHFDPYNGALSNRTAGSPVANDPAVSEAGGSPSDALLKNYRGLQPYDDIVDAKHAERPYDSDGSIDAEDVDVGPLFTVQVEQPIENVRTSGHVQGIGRDRIQLADQADAGAMSASASSQIYFSRPRAGWPFSRQIDDRRELGNLFSPYWQARPVDTPESIKLGFKAGSVVMP